MAFREIDIMRNTKSFFLIGLALAVSACGTQNRGLESVQQPVVSRTDYVLDVNAGGGGLDAREVGRVEGWFESLRIGYGDRVSVDLGDGGYGSAARESVAAIAAKYGLLLTSTAPITAGSVPAGNVRVIVSRSKATVPGCPDWSRPSEANFGSHNASNYGCAINGNLAAMVADPQDLVLGRGGDSASDASTSGKAIKSYRERKPTGEGGLKNESSRTGN
jgi:pilus assembly protein CpaD